MNLTDPSGGNRAIIGTLSSAVPSIIINATNNIDVRATGRHISTFAFVVGVEYAVVINYDGSQLLVTANGQPIIDVVDATMVFSKIDFIGGRIDDTNAPFAGIIKDIRLQDLVKGDDVLWALDSGSTVSEESINDPDTLIFHNVVAGDWSQET
jgi:hypothetical protein